MIKSDFDFFADTVILKFYDEIKQIDLDKYNGKILKFNQNKLYQIFNRYETFRKEMRKLYMAEESKAMDRHKIAANMMVAILKVHPVKVNLMVSGLPIELALANEYLAFFCALNIVEMYRRDAKVKDFSLILPPTYISEEDNEKSYLMNVCKALYYTKKLSISDILSYSNVLFMIERYTDTINERRNEEKESGDI